MSVNFKQVRAFADFLGDGHWNGAALQECVRAMYDALIDNGYAPPQARQLLLGMMPADKRAIAAAMLPKGARGRPKGSHVGDAAYSKAYALLDVYHWTWRKHGKAAAALAELAALKDSDIDSIKRQLVRAKKRLTPADLKVIEAVNGE